MKNWLTSPPRFSKAFVFWPRVTAALALLAVSSPALAQTWMPTSAPVTNWSALASSADGTRLMAAAAITSAGGPIFISTNSGATWTPTTAPITNWNSLACSTDGTKVIAVPQYGEVYISTDAGGTWTGLTNVPPAHHVACSADGTKLFVGSGSFNPCCRSPFYTSTNLGASWTASGLVSVWQTIATSADGTTVLATEGMGSLYISHDSGANLTPVSLPWLVGTLACSADGRKLAAVGFHIYTSADSGATWTINDAPDGGWSAVACSADGNKQVAATSAWGIWTSQSKPAPVLNIRPSGGNLVLSWTVPSLDFVLQMNSDPTTTNWTDVTNTPMLNLANLQNEVVVSPSASSRFYRLKH